jgi:hypothetical protein
MYTFLQRFFPLTVVNLLMILWYSLLILLCVYCSYAEEGEFRYDDW